MSLLSGRRTALVLPWELKAGQTPATADRCATTTARALAPSPRSRPACSPASSIATEAGAASRSATYRGYIEQKQALGTSTESEIIK